MEEVSPLATVKPFPHPVPIMMSQCRRMYYATATCGEAKVLQGDGSDVSLNVPQGSVGVFQTTVYTDHSTFRNMIPDDECIVGLSVEVQHKKVGKEIPTMTYTLKIPHTIKDATLWKYIRVRKADTCSSAPVQELEQRNKGEG